MPNNKAMHMSDKSEAPVNETEFNFPIEGITVRAKSEAEAREKLEDILRKQRSTNEGEEK